MSPEKIMSCETNKENKLIYTTTSTLSDTSRAMSSSDYKERFQAEYIQTKVRYEKLKNFCNKIDVAEILGKEPPKHDCPLYLLRDQQHVMGEYLHILELRAIIENIDLT